MTASPLVLVTRPAREAARWVQALRDAGLEARAMPLIEIAPVLDAAALAVARARWRDYHALMFVSAAAVTHFWASGCPQMFAGAASDVAALPRCWATGPGTVRGLREVGVPDAVIDAPALGAAQFDSEGLWALVGPQLPAAAGVLIVRGGDASGQARGRDWLVHTLQMAGAQVDTVVAYRRLVPPLDAAALELAVLGMQGRSAVWLFSSAEAISNLRRLVPDASWQSACAFATHPRIAQAARDAGFGTVVEASPDLGALTASIKSLR